MIKPGWKRDVCPQCHMPGRVGERIEKELQAEDSTIKFYRMFIFRGPSFSLSADMCDNCGVLYAFECRAVSGSVGGSDDATPQG